MLAKSPFYSVTPLRLSPSQQNKDLKMGEI